MKNSPPGRCSTRATPRSIRSWSGRARTNRTAKTWPFLWCPVYIQEKIHPQAIIDALPRTERTGDDQANLFADFNGLEDDFEKKVDFYSQKDDRQKPWSNRLILGDSLLVMTSLAEKEGLKGKVQAIYFDPPYGIKFGSNWQVSTRKRDVKDSKAQDATRQPEQVRAFRDTWKLGIHSYLSYLRDRLIVARDLLTETGSVFVQIGDENVHRVRALMDEVFGSENFVRLILFQKTGGLVQNFLPRTCDFLVWYAKDRNQAKFRKLHFQRSAESSDYQYIELANVTRRSLTAEERKYLTSIPEGRLYSTTSLESANPTFPFIFGRRTYTQRWKTNDRGLNRLAFASRLSAEGRTLRYVRFFEDFPVRELQDVWSDTMGERNITYVVQTNATVIQRCILMTTDPGDLVLDPTCGSGTTAYVSEQWGRRWITCDTSRVALALARTRLMAARYPYYLLADSPEGIQKESELTGKIPPEYKTHDDIRKGFVYERVPHVTLKSIANNAEINVIWEKHQETLEPLREKLTVRSARPGRSGKSPAPLRTIGPGGPSWPTPGGGNSVSPDRRKSTLPSPAMPTPRRSTTNLTRATSASGYAARSRWKVSHRTACYPPPTKIRMARSASRKAASSRTSPP